ncbi:hypothetical protein RJT34_02977 [Clitoria ternatea]|uniref:MBD domain-containing protein n=1 Tax=Clitoria ternatea TaxID=43366 RepID=A0AAN9KL87_CLITE
MGNHDVVKSEETNGQMDSSTKCNSKKKTVEKANERPEWLPNDWDVEFRIRKSGAHMGSGYKCYIDPLNGYKFYSKPEVFRYLETIKDNSCTSKKQKKCTNMHSPTDIVVEKSPGEVVAEKSPTKVVAEKSPVKVVAEKSPAEVVIEKSAVEDLPPGWVKEVKIRKNKKGIEKDPVVEKSPVEVVAERSPVKFVAEKSPLNVVAEKSPVKVVAGKSPVKAVAEKSPVKVEIEKSPVKAVAEKSPVKVEVERSPVKVEVEQSPVKVDVEQSPVEAVSEKSTVEDLPPGWVKEVKIRKNTNGNRKDAFYSDPVSGYVFRSKKDVMRYLESGDICSCAFKPTRGPIQNEDNLTPSTTAKRQKSKLPVPKEQPSVATEILDRSSIGSPDANNLRKGEDVNVPFGMMVTPVPTPMIESVVKMHSLENRTVGAANSSEMMTTAHPSSSAPLKNESLQESGEVLSADVQEKVNVVDMVENANGKTHSSHRKSKNKEFYVRHRFSPRLAGIKPANNVISEQSFQISNRNPRKSRNTVNVEMENKSSEHSNDVPAIELVHKMQQEVINISEDQVVSKEQPHHQEIVKIEDNKPAIQTDSNKSSNKKKHRVPRRRASKRLPPGFEHVVMNSKSSEKAPKYKSKKSKDEVKVEWQQSEDRSIAVLAAHAPINGESANKGKKSPKISSTADNKVKQAAHVGMDDEKSEPGGLSFASHYSWSDPSLEFAMNTLTGVLPPVENSVDNRPTIIPETDIQKTLMDNVTERSRDSQNNMLGIVTGSRDRNSQVRSDKPNRKKELKVPMRLSKQLAGLEPEVLPSQRAVEYSTRKPCTEPIATSILTNGDSSYLDAMEETKPTIQASESLKTEVLGELANKSEKSFDVQIVDREQLLKVKAENIGDRESEPQLPVTFGDSWSDPCLEFAIKTLTGALPVDTGADILPVMTRDVDDPLYKQSHGSVVTSNNEEARDNSNQFLNRKELNMVSQPELRTGSTSCANAPKVANRESFVD